MQFNKKKYDALVFDFDGVIADSVEVKTKAFVKLFEKYDSEIQQKIAIHHSQHGGMTRVEKIRYYYNAFIGKTLDNEILAALCDEFSELVVDKVVAASEIQGVKDFLDFCNSTALCFIDSATPDAEIVKIVSRRGLRKYFYEILGSGKSKADNLTYILEKYQIEPRRCLFFGDAASDYNAARERGVDFVGILPDSDAPLLQHAPNIRWFHNFSEILGVITNGDI